MWVEEVTHQLWSHSFALISWQIQATDDDDDECAYMQKDWLRQIP